MGNTTFTSRLRDAIDLLPKRFLRPFSGSLFSPVLRKGAYRWVKVMDSDGLLLAESAVQPGDGRGPENPVKLLLAVVIQSEDSTSQTKPNPLGKASLAHIQNGIWVDIASETRRRIDQLLVLFVLPKGAAPKRQKAFHTARRNVENAAAMMPGTETLAVSRGSDARTIVTRLKKPMWAFFRHRD